MVALPLVSWAYWRAKSRKIVNSKENKFRHAESDGSFGGTLNTAARSSRERDLECEMGPRGMISDSISTSIEWYSAISDRVQAVLASVVSGEYKPPLDDSYWIQIFGKKFTLPNGNVMEESVQGDEDLLELFEFGIQEGYVDNLCRDQHPASYDIFFAFGIFELLWDRFEGVEVLTKFGLLRSVKAKCELFEVPDYEHDDGMLKEVTQDLSSAVGGCLLCDDFEPLVRVTLCSSILIIADRLTESHVPSALLFSIGDGVLPEARYEARDDIVVTQMIEDLINANPLLKIAAAMEEF